MGTPAALLESEATSIEIAFSLILHAGNSRSASIQAARAAEKGDFNRAAELLDEADAEMHRAHDIQSAMLREEMGGADTELTLAMVHAQDHLTMAMLQRESTAQLMSVYRELRAQRALIEQLLER